MSLAAAVAAVRGRGTTMRRSHLTAAAFAIALAAIAAASDPRVAAQQRAEAHLGAGWIEERDVRRGIAGPQSRHGRPRSLGGLGTRPASVPASVAGPTRGGIPSTRMALRPRDRRSRPSLEPTSSPVRSRTRSSR